jgi:hypothetical protein
VINGSRISTGLAVAACLVALLIGCSSAKELETTVASPMHAAGFTDYDGCLIGMTVQGAVNHLELILGSYFIIEEPPDVVRGVRGKDRSGEEVWLYVDRIELLNGSVQDWKFERLAHLIVIGVARKRGDRWQRYGQVIWYYHSN